MTFLHRLVSMLRWVIHRHQADRELNDEMEAFVDMAAADRMSDGVTAAAAVRNPCAPIEVTAAVAATAADPARKVRRVGVLPDVDALAAASAPSGRSVGGVAGV